MNQKGVNRKLRCILSTDVVGYSRLMEKDETSTVLSLEENKKLISRLIEEYNGRVVDSPGDNLLAEFGSAVKAVVCAVEIQEKLKAKNDQLEENKRMEFRIGINVGDVIEEDGRLYGSGVNRAARLEGLAKPGEIYVSRNVFDQVKISLALGYEYLGEYNVKNLTEPVRVYKVLTEEKFAGEVIGDKKILGRIIYKIRDHINNSWRRRSAIIVLLILIGAGLINPRSCQYFKSKLPSRIIMSILPFRPPDLEGDLKVLATGLKSYMDCKLTECREQYPLTVITPYERQKSNIHTVQEEIREFGVNLLLVPTLEQIAEKIVRINYLLIHANTQEALGSDFVIGVYDTEDMDNRIKLEDDFFASVLKNLKIDIFPEEGSVMARETQELEAYDYYWSAANSLKEYQKLESVQSAIDDLHVALEKDPEYAIAHATLGEARWRLYKYKQEPELLDKALSDCFQSLAHDSKLARGYCCLGTLFNGKGDYEKAVDQFKQAIDLDPNCDEAIQGLGNAYKELEKFDEAEKTYKNSIEERPEYWVGYNNLGSLYMYWGRFPEAAETFLQMTELVPEHHYGYSNLGGAYVQDGRYSDAIPVLKHSIKIRHTEEAFSNLGTAYFYQGRFNDAVEAYEKAIEFDNKDWMIWGNLGDARYWNPANRDRAGEAYQEALKLAKEKLEVNPHNVMLFSFMAYYSAMVDEEVEAHDYMKKVIDMDTKNPAILFNLALTYSKLRDTDQTLHWLKKALEARWPKEIIYNTPLLNSLGNNQEFKDLLKDY